MRNKSELGGLGCPFEMLRHLHSAAGDLTWPAWPWTDCIVSPGKGCGTSPGVERQASSLSTRVSKLLSISCFIVVFSYCFFGSARGPQIPVVVS